MNKQEVVKTLIIKYGALEVSRNYIRGIRSALSSIRSGIENNNPQLAAKDVGLLAEHLSNLELVFNDEEARKQIQKIETK